MRILIGDDNKEALSSLKRALRGLELDLAYTPEETIGKASQARYDKIVTDLDYTERGAEGFRVLREIRNKAQIRALYTARADEIGIREEAEKNGATHVIAKQDLMGLIRLLRS